MKIFKTLSFLTLLVAGGVHADTSPQKWARTAIPVPYKVFAHTSINGVADFQGSVLGAVQRGFAHWNQAAVPTTFWASRYDGPFSSPSGRAAIANDNQNSVIWLEGADWEPSSTVLGLTTVTYRVSTNEIFDGDMQLNNNYQWKVGGAGAFVDVESIITHEAGHFLGLAHTADPAAIMYASYTIGTIKVDLQLNDIRDVSDMYPSGSTTGTQGDFCTSDSNCAAAGLVCRGARGTSVSRICTAECTSDATCLRGYTCQPAEPPGGTGNACLYPPGSPELCRFCTGSAQCSNGLCIRSGRNMLCSRPCQTQADCGSAYECVSSGTTDGGIGSRYCVPAQGRCPTPQCATNADCYQGFACVGGMCQATGNTGDHCAVSFYCAQCNVCVLAPGGGQDAFCRICCGGQGQGGRCNSCTPATCFGGSCAALRSSTDQICTGDGGVTSSPPGVSNGTDTSPRNGCGCNGSLPSTLGLATVLMLIALRAGRKFR